MDMLIHIASLAMKEQRQNMYFSFIKRKCGKLAVTSESTHMNIKLVIPLHQYQKSVNKNNVLAPSSSTGEGESLRLDTLQGVS